MTRFGLTALVLAAALVGIAGCGSDRIGRDERAGYAPMAVAAFNKRIASGAGLSTPPRRIALEFLGLREGGGPEEPKLTIDESVMEHNATVFVVADGLADDSVQSRRYRIELNEGSRGWLIAWAGWQQRCQPQRGHQSFTRELCA